MDGVRFVRLTAFPGQTHEFARDPSVAVVAHRVRGIVVARRQFFIAFVERNRLEPRIDEAFRQLLQFGVPRRTAPPKLDLPISSDKAAVRGDFPNFRLPQRDVRDRTRLAHRLPHRRHAALQAGVEECGVEGRRQIALGRDQRLRLQTSERRVVLMHALHGHSIRRSAGRLRQRLAPLQMAAIQDSRPVDRADHDRPLAAPHQHESDRLRTVVHRRHRLDPAATTAMAERRCDIEPKRSDPRWSRRPRVSHRRFGAQRRRRSARPKHAAFRHQRRNSDP